MLLLCVAPRRFQRGLKRKPLALIKKLRKAKKDAAQGEKPEAVRTHLRNMIIVPEMIGSVIGVYNGKTFNQVRAAQQQCVCYGIVACACCMCGFVMKLHMV
jgi:small subunit ribosomal protein S15e